MPIWNAVKGIRHEHEVNRPWRKLVETVGITFHEVAIHRPGRHQAMSRKLQNLPVDVDREDVAGDLRHWQGEPAVSEPA